MPLTLTVGANSFSMEVRECVRTDVGKMIQVAAPGINPFLVGLGREGPEFAISGYIISSADYDALNLIKANDIAQVTVSNVMELVVGQNFHITRKKTSRKGGWVSLWNVDLTLTRKWQ